MTNSEPTKTAVDIRRYWGRFLLVAACFGLTSGLLEVGVLTVRRYWLEKALVVSTQFIWMVPAVALLLCVVAGFVALCATAVCPRKLQLPIAFFALAFLAFLGPLFAVPRLHYLAVLILAAGAATQTTRFLLSRSLRSFTVAPLTFVLLMALVVSLAIGVNGAELLDTHRAIAERPQSPAGAPNVLLVVLDTVRAKSLSLYGYGKPTTPGLERLAERSVVFDAAISAAPWTLPSHATMFTGHWPHELTVDWTTPLDGTYPTLAGVLKDQGYVTAGFVSNLIYASSAHGLGRGFTHYEDFPVSVGQAIVSSSLGAMISSSTRLRRRLNYQRVLNRKTVEEVNGEFLDWLSHRSERPFFAFLNYMDAHEPYLPPKPFEGEFGPPRDRAVFEHSPIDAFRPAKWNLSPAQVQSEIAEYDASVAYIDHELEKLIGELTKRGLMENTLLIVTADHGEHIGEHRLFGHGNSLYRTVLEVPLLISFPGHVPVGTTVQAPVTLRDIPATVMDLIGLSNRSPFPGVSLSRYWRQPTGEKVGIDDPVISEAGKRVFGAQRPWYPLSQGNMKSIVSAGYHYIQNDTGDEELYDFEKDPEESRDLSHSDEGKLKILQLRESLAVHP